MPRLAKDAIERQREAVLHAIDVYTADRIREGDDCETIAKRLGFGYCTLHSRKKNPEKFTLAELQRMANVMNIPLGTFLGLGIVWRD